MSGKVTRGLPEDMGNTLPASGFTDTFTDISRFSPPSETLTASVVETWEKAEGVGFEPTMPCGIPVFKTGAFDRSATPPLRCERGENRRTFAEAQCWRFGLA